MYQIFYQKTGKSPVCNGNKCGTSDCITGWQYDIGLTLTLNLLMSE